MTATALYEIRDMTIWAAFVILAMFQMCLLVRVTAALGSILKSQLAAAPPLQNQLISAQIKNCHFSSSLRARRTFPPPGRSGRVTIQANWIWWRGEIMQSCGIQLRIPSRFVLSVQGTSRGDLHHCKYNRQLKIKQAAQAKKELSFHVPSDSALVRE